MAKYLIKGGRKLKGEIKISGNKNSALALLPAALLGDTPSTFFNVPVIRDVWVMGELIQKLGAKVEGIGTNTITIDPRPLCHFELDPLLSSRIRGSVILAAPLLVKFGKAAIVPPGGDQIGERLLDTHFAMMKKFGVTAKKENGRFVFIREKKKAEDVFLEEVSVTATEMAIMLASSLKKEIVIDDAAAEPHVVDLSNFISQMGATVLGAGTNHLRIKGRGLLKGNHYRISPDYVEGGTFAIASAITGGNVLIVDFVPEHYPMILHYLSSMGVKFRKKGGKLEILPSKLVAKKRKFQTRPWPGFPTDLMSPFIVLATQARGTVLCHDWMYEWRVFFVDDLISMGANIFIADPHRVVVTGPTPLYGERLYCKDIRAGVSIVLAALVASGASEIENIEMVERGYENLEGRLRMLGAEIKRVNSVSKIQ